MNGTIHADARIQVEGVWATTHRQIICTIISERYGIYKVRLPNGKVASVGYADITIHGDPDAAAA
jgi:hypothetical protein